MRMTGRLLIMTALAAVAVEAAGLTVEEAVRQALENHPLLAAQAGRSAAARGARLQAGLKPNPMLVVQTENLRAHGEPAFSFNRDPESFLYLQQVIETAGKRDRRVGVASADVGRADLERELLVQQIAFRVKLAYWEAAAAERGRQVLEQTAGNFEEVVRYHQVRVREGAMAEADLIRVVLELERLRIGLARAMLDAERGRIELFREMGKSDFPAVGFSDPLAMESAPPVADETAAMEARPELRLARLAVERAQARVALEQSLAKPDLTVLGGLKRIEGFSTVVAGLQFDLPFRDRNQGNIEAAGHEVETARATLAAVSAVVRAEVRAAALEVEIRRRQLETLLPGLERNAAESASIAQAAYREGATELLRLLDAERVRLEVNQTRVRAAADYRQSVARLEAALGVAP